MPPEPVVVFCPCCCSAVEGSSADREFSCSHCGQKWVMEDVDLARLAAQSPA